MIELSNITIYSDQSTVLKRSAASAEHFVTHIGLYHIISR
jgi:hypothetical protein